MTKQLLREIKDDEIVYETSVKSAKQVNVNVSVNVDANKSSSTSEQTKIKGKVLLTED